MIKGDYGMALINCPECNKQVSDNAKSCPDCGFPIRDYVDGLRPEKEEVGRKKRRIDWKVIVLIFLCLFSPALGAIFLWIFKKPHKIWKRIVFTILLLLIHFVLLLGDDESVTEPQNANTINETETIEEKSEVEIYIDDHIIYDKNDVKIQAKSISDKGSYYSLDIYIENNSKLNLGFNAHSYAINKINTGNNIYEMDCDVASGKKANTSLEIDKKYFDFVSTSPIKSIDVLIWAYDNDASFKEFDTGQITINTNLYDEKFDFLSGENIYDNNGITVEYLFADNDKYYFQFCNNSDSYLDFNVENLTINNFTSSEMDLDLWGISALKDCKAIFSIDPSSDFLETNDISEIEKIEFTLNVIPMEDYFKEWNTEMITIEF